MPRPAVIGLVFLTLGVSHGAAQSPDRAVLQRLLTAEDARGHGPDGLAPLLENLRSRDSLLRRVAVRGVGRLQRPDLAASLVPALGDTLPAIRAEAAIAIAQSLRGLPRGEPVADSGQLTVAGAHQALISAVGRESHDSVAGVMAEAIGRLQLVDSLQGRAAEQAILARAGEKLNYGMAHGLFWLTLGRRFSGGLSTPSLTLLRAAARTAPDTNLRRMAVLTLARSDALDSATTRIASRDRDAQVRRLALAGAAGLNPGDRAVLVRQALADSSVIVRVAAVGAARAGSTPPDCAPIIAATRDRHPYVVIAAVAGLGLPCADPSAAAETLVGLLDRHPRALVSLSRIDSARAMAALEGIARSPRWLHRLHAATAAANLKSTATLYRLSRDRDDNVREAAILGLTRVSKHEADSVYLAALASEGNQVLLAAGNALEGSSHPRALETILSTFDRISRRRSENARDPRLSLLQRIGEMGSPATAPRITPYLADFDTSIAKTAAELVSRWTGTPVDARPQPLPIHPEPLAEYFLADNLALRVTMTSGSGRSSFVIRLFPRETPATVARFVRRAREHYYDGHLIQRVEPNFVIQGGGPGASEYVGDDFFMRDEVAFHSHYRGTVGTSTRGRDTGDAQLFINLADNPALDHEFTVFGQVVEGMEVVDGILEGDAIETIAVLPSR